MRHLWNLISSTVLAAEEEVPDETLLEDGGASGMHNRTTGSSDRFEGEQTGGATYGAGTDGASASVKLADASGVAVGGKPISTTSTTCYVGI